MKILFHYPPTFPFMNPKTLKGFAKNFSHQNEVYHMPSKRKKNEARKAKKEGRGESKTAVTFNPPKKFAKFCFLLMPELRKLIGNLRKDVFERRTLTRSEALSLFVCLDADKFVLLSVFSLIKRI